MILSGVLQSMARRGAASFSRTPILNVTRREKSVLVTGGAQGLGAAICERLANDGYSVVVADVLEEQGEKVAEVVKGTFVKTDVTEPVQVESAVAAALQQHGSLDALVNNAGIVGSQVSIAEYDVNEWKQIIDVNLNGTFYGLKYGLAQMKIQESGSIVNMSSILGFRGMQNLGPYTPSKFAVRGMTKAAAVEYGRFGIRINAIAPAACETPMVKAFLEKAPESLQDSFTAPNALPGFVQPSDVASACAFLLSNDAKYITGHTLAVDAGSLSRLANAVEKTD